MTFFSRRRGGCPTFLLAVLALAIGACGGSSVDLPEDPGTTDTGGLGDGSADGLGGDTNVSGDSGGDTSVPPTDGPPTDTTPPPTDGTACDLINPSTTDVYVDKTYTGASTGTAACPFKAIVDATSLTFAAGITRTVHVAGGTPSYDYLESAIVHVVPRMVLLGAGAATTKIGCAGCAGRAVLVDAGGTIDGFTVAFGGGDAIAAGGGTISSTSGPAIIKNVVATSSVNGISTLGSVDIGPNVSSTGNSKHGVYSSGPGGSVHVVVGAGGGLSHFDKNAESGISMEGNANLKFDGGTANGNSKNGIRMTTGVAHSISGLTARGNTNIGVTAFNASLTIRRSILLQNKYGMIFIYSGSNTLDMGTTTSGGSNTFGVGLPLSDRNSSAGICLGQSGATGSQPGEGDKWAVCPPAQVPVTTGECGSTLSTYSDIVYVPKGGPSSTNVNPVSISTGGCSVGP